MTSRFVTFLTSALFAAGMAMTAPAPAAAQQPSDEQDVVNAARRTVDRLRADPDLASINRMLTQAKGVIVFPSLIKGAFFIGGEGGSGVLLARDARGTWSAPAFYTMGSLGIGIQAGVQQSSAMFIVMTQAGLDRVMSNQVKLGADASIAAGPVGRGVETATAFGEGADIYAYADARGVFAGLSFEGSWLQHRADWNRAYYGQNVTVRDIVIDNKVTNPGANDLRLSLAPR